MFEWIWVNRLNNDRTTFPKSWQFTNVLARIKNRFRNVNEMRRERLLARLGLKTEARKNAYSLEGGGKEVEVNNNCPSRMKLLK